MLLLKLAIRNILRQKRRSFLTGISMAIGFLMAAITMGLVEGSYATIIDAFTRDRTGHIQVHAEDYLERPSLYKRIRNVDDVVTRITQVSGVVAASPRVFAPSLAFANEKTSMGSVIGIDPQAESATTSIGEKHLIGPFLGQGPAGAMSSDGYDIVMIGQTVAKNLRLEIGDELVLIGQGIDGSIANDIYLVGSIIGTKDGSERFNIYMTIDAARRYLYMGPDAHEIALMTESPDDAIQIASRINTELNQGIPDNTLTADPWQVVEATFFNAMTADKQGNYVTTAIIMAMVAIGVLNAVLMSVLERTREYGLLRAVGTRPRQIFNMIVVETMMLGLLSCLVGFITSIPLLNILEERGIPIPPMEVGGMRMEAMVAEISAIVFVFPFALVLVTAFLVSLWPAARSARLTPVAALGAT